MPGATKILNCITQIFLLPVYGVAWLLGSPYLMTLLCIMSEVLVELVVSTVMAGVSLVVSAVILMEDDNRPLQVPPVDFQKAIKNVPKISPAQVEQSTEESPTDADITKTPVPIDTFFDMTRDGTKPLEDSTVQLVPSDENEKTVTPLQELITGEPAEMKTTNQEDSGSGTPANIKEEKGDIQEGSTTIENGSEQTKSKEETKEGSGSLETVPAAESAPASKTALGTSEEQTPATD